MNTEQLEQKWREDLNYQLNNHIVGEDYVIRCIDNLTRACGQDEQSMTFPPRADAYNDLVSTIAGLRRERDELQKTLSALLEDVYDADSAQEKAYIVSRLDGDENV